MNLVLIDRALEGANRVRRGAVIVIGDDLDHPPIDATLGVDFVRGQLGGLRDRGTGNRLGFGDHADLDRVGGKSLIGDRRQQAEGGRSQKSPH